MARAFADANVQTVGDVWFVGTVGEEGLGNLRGVRALFRDHAGIDGFISIDGGDMGRVTLGATGSQRYRVTYRLIDAAKREQNNSPTAGAAAS